jgi:hypothetical protein
MSAPLEVIEYYVPRKGGRVIKGDVLLFISPTPFKGNRRGGGVSLLCFIEIKKVNYIKLCF